jgi:hypothetical protein
MLVFDYKVMKKNIFNMWCITENKQKILVKLRVQEIIFDIVVLNDEFREEIYNEI